MKMNIDVIVLSAGANGLGAIRALARNGLAVGALAESEHDVSLLSREPVWKVGLTEKTFSSDAVVAALDGVRYTKATLIPTSDRMASALATHREDLEKDFTLCLPSSELLELCIDKEREVARIRDIVPVPNSILDLPATKEEFLTQLNLPVIIKPRSHRHYVIKAKNRILHSEAELSEFYEVFGAVRGSVIAQELIPGPDSNQWVCNCVFDQESNLVSAFTFRRLSLSPAHRGVTSYAVSERCERVMELSTTLGKTLGFVGPAMLEFKQNSRNSEYEYIELNPRLGMCNGFDSYCGVPNVVNAYRVANGLTPEYVIYGRPGVFMLNLYGDMYARLKDGDGFLETLWVYAQNMFKPHTFLFFDLRDPRPGIHVELQNMKEMLVGVGRKIRRLLS